MNISPGVITIAVVMVFAYIVVKKTLLPRLALKRAAKAGLTSAQQAGQVPAGQASAEKVLAGLAQTVMGTASPPFTDLMQPGRFSGQSFQTSRPVTCFDMRLIDLSTIGKGDGDTFDQRITYAASEMLLGLCSRGAVPTLGAVMLMDDLLMLYATYTA